MACTDCMDNQFFTDKSQEFLTEHGIPVNVSKPILKILYHSLDDCGLNCCDNVVEVDSVIQYRDDGDPIAEPGEPTVIDFVGGGVTASYSDITNTITITIPGGGGGGLVNGVYGDITVSDDGATWTMNANSVDLIDIKDIPQLTVLGNPTTSTAPVSTIRIDPTYGINVIDPGTGWRLKANVYGQNVGAGTGVYKTSNGYDLQFKTLVPGSGVGIVSDANTVTISSSASAPTIPGLTLWGNPTAFPAPPTSITIGGGFTVSGLPGSQSLNVTGLSDGPKGEITVSGGGNTWTINNSVVEYSNIQNVSAGKILGRNPSTPGPIEELTIGSGLTLTGTTLSSVATPSTNAWGLGGNDITAGQYIGTNNDNDIVFKRDEVPVGKLAYQTVAFGQNAALVSINPITAIGHNALENNTTGTFNTALGGFALRNNTTGFDNTATGAGALQWNTTGGTNTANGVSTLHFNTTGISNTANGGFALFHNTTGNSNTANGGFALFFNTTGNNNTASGATALYNNTTGSANIANGVNALLKNTTGPANIAIGYEALYNNTTGSSNTATGYQALYSNTTGSNNTGIGFDANVVNNNQAYSTVVGASARVSTSNTIKLGRSTEDSVVIGQDGKVDSAKLAVVSTTQGFLPPVMTTAQRDSINSGSFAIGLIVFNTSVSKLQCWDGSAWQNAW